MCNHKQSRPCVCVADTQGTRLCQNAPFHDELGGERVVNTGARLPQWQQAELLLLSCSAFILNTVHRHMQHSRIEYFRLQQTNKKLF